MAQPIPANDATARSVHRQDILRKIPLAEKRLADCVRAEYNTNDLTHIQIARKLGMNPNELMRILEGQSGMPLSRAVEILAVLGKDLFFEAR